MPSSQDGGFPRSAAASLRHKPKKPNTHRGTVWLFCLGFFRLFIIILYYTDQRSTERRFDGIYASTPRPGAVERNHLLSLMIFCDVIITSLEACWCARFAASRTFAFVQNKQKFTPACAWELACTVPAAPGTGRKESVIFTAGFRLNYSGFSTCSYMW